MRQLKRVLPLLAIVIAMTVAPLAVAQERDQSTRGNLFLDNGDLVTASGKNDSLLRFRPRNNSLTVTKQPLGVRLKPKGIAYRKFCEKVAIANVHNVVVYDVWSGEIEVITNRRFKQLRDVEWDFKCRLLIADAGGESVGRWPRDGEVWVYGTDGSLSRAGGRHAWVNPSLLDMDEWGTLYVVDKGAGQPMPGTNNQWHFDAIYKTGMPDYRYPKALYAREGLDVSAFAVHPDGSFYIGNGAELLWLANKQLYSLCSGQPFKRINGIDISPNLKIHLVDGFDVFGESEIYRLENVASCKLRLLAEGPMVNGVQGLAIGLPAR